MKKLTILIVIAVALLFSGCNPVAPDYPECPECPDCICGECPDCVCPPGGGSCSCPSCPSCPDLDCPDIPVPDAPVIVSFTADPPILTCKCCCGFPKWGGDPCPDGDCNDKSTISWEVTGAVIVSITPKLEGWLGDMYVDATGSEQVKCKNLDLGVNTWTLTATNGVGFVTADVTITREITLPVIDGVLSPGEWDCATIIPIASGSPSMGNVWVLATTDYLYLSLDAVDSTDNRFEDGYGNDKVGLNINPTDGGPWGKPYDIVFQTGTDPDAFTTPDPNPDNSSSGQTDGYETEWCIDGIQLNLPIDLVTKTIYGGGNRVSEWKVPLTTIAPSPGDILKVGGAADNLANSGGSFSFPDDLDWNNASTFVDIVVY